jgi:hypothetical protein
MLRDIPCCQICDVFLEPLKWLLSKDQTRKALSVSRLPIPVISGSVLGEV